MFCSLLFPTISPLCATSVGLAKTIHTYVTLSKEITTHTAISGVHIRFWPTLLIFGEFPAKNTVHMLYAVCTCSLLKNGSFLLKASDTVDFSFCLCFCVPSSSSHDPFFAMTYTIHHHQFSLSHMPLLLCSLLLQP